MRLLSRESFLSGLKDKKPVVDIVQTLVRRTSTKLQRDNFPPIVRNISALF